jgi:flagellar biosynthesis protein FlhB
MSDNQEQKQHQASSKRLDDLRDSGQTLRSKDLSSGLILVMSIIMLIFMSGHIGTRISNNFVTSFGLIASVDENPNKLLGQLGDMLIQNITLLIPVFLLIIASALASVFLLGGWNFTLKAVEFKWEKLNPATNLGNIFSKRMLSDVVKSTCKFIFIIGLFALFIKNNSKELLSLTHLPLHASFHLLCSMIVRFVIILCLAIAAIVILDVFLSYRSYQNKTMMTTQELKEEMKSTEGNADVKRRLRSLQYSILKQKIPQMIPQATVVITNPTHYAVALQYIEGKDKAPKVLAKGKGGVAQYMRKLAISNGIPIYEEPPLARAIFHTTKTGGFINPGLYLAVAIVLAYINQLSKYQSGQAALPVKASQIDLPAGFYFKE